jgi:ribonuclease P protein component
MRKDETFQKKERLAHRDDFARVYGLKCSAGDDVLVVYAAPNELGFTRIGISVSRRVGIAVRRNYIRRRIREAFRKNKDQLPQGVDLICIAKRDAGDKNIDVTESLVRLSRRAADRCNRSRVSRGEVPGED